jgi:predicted ATPase
MVIVEDLHWINGETQALLNLLVDAIANARILLLVNYRPEYRHEWGSRTYYTRLRLDPLGRENAEAMLDALLSTSAPLPSPASQPHLASPATERERDSQERARGPEGQASDLTALKRLIIERTQGNPFFMEETVQALLDDGALVRNGQVKLTRPLADLKIPLTVQAMLAARIDRLPSAEKELLQTLAVIGKELALELVTGVAGKREEQLEPILTNLQLGEFIYEQPSVTGLEYSFKHALTQEVAYSSLLVERRRMIHEQTARSIERLYAQQLEDHWSELTHHYLRGIDAAKAVHYAGLAGQQAVSRSAYPEATSITEAALRLLDKIPNSVERIRAELALRAVENTLAFVRFGPSSAERERIAGRMCKLGERIGGGEELLRGLQALASIYFSRGEPLRGLALGRQCVQLA